jgi:deoxyadenosine/deoxycytidine kinase
MDIIVEGNIGVGKTTYLKMLKDFPDEELDVNVEPLSIWKGLGLLDSFYADQKRWAYTFQSTAFVTRFSVAAQLRKHSDGVRILERSVFADNKCFASTQYEMGNMNEMEWHAYSMWYEVMVNKFPDILNFDKIIYLRATPESCLHRINSRDRNAESKMDVNYLRALHAKYESWLFSPEMVDRVHIVDVEKDWESKESYREQVYADIRKVIAEIREEKS